MEHKNRSKDKAKDNLCLGQGHTPACDPCPDSDRCNAYYWLEEWRFRKHDDPPERHDFLLQPLWEAAEEAYARYPEITFTHRYNRARCGASPDCPACPDMDACADPRGIKRKVLSNEQLEKKRNNLVIARVKKAKEDKAKELRAAADRSLEEAAAIDASGPRGSRFPYGWMLDASRASRGARQLLDLMILVKEITKTKSSELLTDRLVASGRWERKELCEHYRDKNGNERSWPPALFQMDYALAEKRHGWRENKTNRLLRLACNAGVFQNMGKAGPTERIIYYAGYWMTISGISWVNWLVKKDNGGEEVFRGFRLT